jgi:hypothetical protein
VLDRGLNELLERWHMDIRKSLDVQARLTARVFPKLGQHLIVLFKTGHNIQRDILFAGRKPGEHPIGLTATGVFVVIAPEPDDAAAPHLRPCLRSFLHDIDNRPTILADVLVLDRVEKIVNRGLIEFCL